MMRALLIAMLLLPSSANAAEVYQQLDKWSVQLPVNTDGELEGHMASYTANRDRKPWYDIDGSKLHFYNPGEGATAFGSPDRTRTELKQKGTWTSSWLELDMAVRSGEGTTSILQVWSHSQNKPLLMVRYQHDRNGVGITVWDRNRNTTRKSFSKTLKYGQRFKLKVKNDGRMLTVTLDGTTMTLPVPSGMGPNFSFKFGTYIDRAKTTVYRATLP